MTKRDPNKTARNKKIAQLKADRRKLQSGVFKELKAAGFPNYCNELSLNAFIGSKADEYLDLRNDVIKTPMEYLSKWVEGLRIAAKPIPTLGADARHRNMLSLLKQHNPAFKNYVLNFLEGSFLKHYEEHYKQKPKIEESEYWFGANNDDYGLLVTPRFANGRWENDKSEIRHFHHPYWTVGHVMETGLCYMSQDKRRTFSYVTDLMQFLYDIARRTGSKYQLEIMSRYSDLVKNDSSPLSIPLLIPELRFDPAKNKHKYRLDLLIINPWSLSKFGVEFSPWSTHGKLKGAGKKMADYDREAQQSFEKEMAKHKSYWRKYGISYITYTDSDLADIDQVWGEIKSHLEASDNPEQLQFALIDDLLG